MQMAGKTIQTGKMRNSSLDVVRTLAIFLVVLNHAVEMIYMSEPSIVASSGGAVSVFCMTVFAFGRIGVPLFLLLTGYLLLSRDYFQSKNGIVDFYKKNLLPLLLSWEIWLLLYNVILAVSGERAFSPVSWISQALFLEAGPMSHCWYIPMILGMYLFVPFLSKILSQMKGRWILFLLGITYFMFFIHPFIKLWWRSITITLDLGFSGGICGLYLILGYLLKRYEKDFNRFWSPVKNKLLLSAGCLVLVVFTIWFAARDSIWYSFFTLPWIGIYIFCAVKQIRPTGSAASVFCEISICAFGIYLLHKLFLEGFKRVLPIQSVPAKILIDTVLAFFVSLLIVSLFGRIGGGRVGKILFLRKRPSRPAPAEKTGEDSAAS